jgi:diguanylate cyclase (GGDEF)-like protein/PAS domain S-box-containing protein
MAQQGTARPVDGLHAEVERLQRALDEQIHFLQEVVDSVPAPVFFEDCSGHLHNCNRALLDLLGVTRGEILGRTLSDVLPAGQVMNDRADDVTLLRSPGARVYELELTTRGGGRRDVAVSKATYLDAEGRVAGVIGVMTDVTDMRRANAQSERLRAELGSTRTKLAAITTSDALTGLGNRRQLEDVIDHEWRRASRSGAPIAFLMIDIDDFHVFNDTYGHMAGDECLVAVADALSVCQRRPGDTLIRYSGEQFLAVLPGASDDGALVVAEAMRDAVRALDIPDRESPRRMLTASVGVAVAENGRYPDPGSAVAAADAAVCRAKRLGCDRVVVADC